MCIVVKTADALALTLNCALDLGAAVRLRARCQKKISAYLIRRTSHSPNKVAWKGKLVRRLGRVGGVVGTREDEIGRRDRGRGPRGRERRGLDVSVLAENLELSSS